MSSGRPFSISFFCLAIPFPFPFQCSNHPGRASARRICYTHVEYPCHERSQEGGELPVTPSLHFMPFHRLSTILYIPPRIHIFHYRAFDFSLALLKRVGNQNQRQPMLPSKSCHQFLSQSWRIIVITSLKQGIQKFSPFLLLL